MGNKRVFITEDQAKMLNEYAVDPKKVRLVADYLDSHFKRGKLGYVSRNGWNNKGIVSLTDDEGNPVRNMTDKQLFYYLQENLPPIYSDEKKRDAFIKKVMKDWYAKKISKEGMLSVNKF